MAPQARLTTITSERTRRWPRKAWLTDRRWYVLTASWTLVHDEDFARYLVFLNEGLPHPTNQLATNPRQGHFPAQPTFSRYRNCQWHRRRRYGLLCRGGGRIDHGRWGKAPAPFDLHRPATKFPVHSGPRPAPGSNGDDGDTNSMGLVYRLDLATTNVYVSTTPMLYVFGRTPLLPMLQTKATSPSSNNPGRSCLD